MEQFTKPVEGQHDGQETAATLGGLQVSDCTGGARRQHKLKQRLIFNLRREHLHICSVL